MSADAWSNLKPRGDCEGDQSSCKAEKCPAYGTLRKADRDGNRRVDGCADKVARGRSNKRLGQRGQAKAATLLGIPRSSLRPGHEEVYGGAVRLEVKSGREAKTVLTAYQRSERQSEAHRPIGDHRPFVASFRPLGSPYGLVVIRDDKLPEAVAALAEQLGMLS